MSDLQSWMMVGFGFIGCGALAFLVKIGRQLVKAIKDVPQIVPLHHAAMAAIGEVKGEVVAVGMKIEATAKTVAELDTRVESVERHITRAP